jgi:hypothetical protein
MGSVTTHRSRTVDYLEEVDVPAEFLWRTITDFANIDQWSNIVVRSVEGDGIGRTRSVQLPSGALVIERVISSDPCNMVFCYEVMSPNPYPMTDYRSTVSIERMSAECSVVRWSGSYSPLEDSDYAKTDNYCAGFTAVASNC